MCQKAGKRCARHMNGTKAVINVAAALSEQPVEEVSKDFSALRKEAKKVALHPPTANMVREFVALQKSVVRNSQMSDHQEKIITNQLNKAADERPDGATFVAWKKLTTRSMMKRHLPKVTAIGVSTVLSISLAACNTGGGRIDPPAPSPTATSTATLTPTPATITGNYMDVTTANDKLGIDVSDSSVTDKFGSYHPTTLSDDSPLLKEDKSTWGEYARSYGDDRILAGQELASRFLVEKMLDSAPTVDESKANQDSLYNATKDMVEEDYATEWKKAVYGNGEDDLPIYDMSSRFIIEDGYTPVYPSDNARVRYNDVKLKKVAADKEGYIGYVYDVNLTRQYLNEKDEPVLFNFTAEYQIVLKDNKDHFELSGWNRTGADYQVAEK